MAMCAEAQAVERAKRDFRQHGAAAAPRNRTDDFLEASLFEGNQTCRLRGNRERGCKTQAIRQIG